GYLALGDLGRFGVTEEGLVGWVRSGAGRDVLSVGDWGRLAGAELGVLSGLAGEVVRELGGEEEVEGNEVLDLNQSQDDQVVINQLLAQQPELTELAKLNAMLQQKEPKKNQYITSFASSTPFKTASQSQSSTGESSSRLNTPQIKPTAIELYNQGTNRRNAGDLMGAIAKYTQALNISPNYADAYDALGIIYCDHLHEYQKAIDDFTKAIEIEKNQSSYWENRGRAYLLWKQYEKAIENFNRAIVLDPCNTSAHGNLGVVYKDLNQYQEAIKNFDQVINIDRRDIYAYCNRGSAYHNLGYYEEAIQDFDRAIKLDPDDAYAYNGRGYAYYKLGYYEEAVRDFDRAIKIEPNHVYSWKNRGFLLYYQSGYQAALDNWNEALDKHINPDTEPLNCAILHQSKGNAYADQSNKYFGVHSSIEQDHQRRSLFLCKATKSYETAYELIKDHPSYTENILKILLNWSISLKALGLVEDSNKKVLEAIQRINKRMLDFADPLYRKYLRLEFQSFYFLNVDRLVSQNDPWQALIEAEKWKSLALTWLQNTNAEPQPLSRETLQTRIQQLCPNPHTAILYWHLSPAQITTFLLRPHQDPQTFSTLTDPPHTPATKTQTNFTEWLKNYKKQYQQHRKKSPSSHGSAVGWTTGGSAAHSQEAEPPHSHDLAEPSHEEEETWRDQLPQTLHHLSQILNIPQLLPHLTPIQTLILIPHRDLHLLPLHALFNNSKVPLAKGDLGGFRITYRPNLTLPIPTHSPIPNPTLLIIKNPHSTIATETLPWAETEVDSLSTLYTSTIIERPNAHLAHITPHLTQPNHQFHFAGHGNSDPDNPLKSCLYLNNEDTLTVETLLTLNLPAYDLVSLSACETALTNTGEFIDEFVGLPSAFLKSGAKQVLSSQWSVESFPTTLTMIEFHRRYRAGMPAAQALAEVQIWLRNLTREDLQTWLQAAQTTWPEELLWRDKLDEIEPWPAGHQPYQNPYYWAAFIVTQ
ncbi:CHAT domain-containing tetratricopeptide repeat protein, partial [Spirulina sp. CCNP1310]|uniref:CHAT domain-containing protein n=1 Tax=Spirulina sp. CCNP1310 TaxID=3110249 RepID=UPI002B1FA28D